jgi:hypothetical protein
MAREFKCYGLRASPKPTRWQARLSSTVRVIDADGRSGYAYINFELPFLRKVGKALPQGISERNPAFLRVEYSTYLKQWLIGAQYLNGPGIAILWRTQTKPAWLQVHRYSLHKATPS